jgi:K+-transporting ATPase KdpF subunit
MMRDSDGFTRDRRAAMTVPLTILLLITIALAGYLLLVMVKPEWF